MKIMWETYSGTPTAARHNAAKLFVGRAVERSHAVLVKKDFDDEQWYVDMEKSRDNDWQHLPDIESSEQVKVVVEMLLRME